MDIMQFDAALHPVPTKRLANCSPGLLIGGISFIEEFDHMQYTPLTTGPRYSRPQLQQAARVRSQNQFGPGFIHSLHLGLQ